MSQSELLHKAKRAVGDEEQFFPMTNQSMQNGIRLFPPQNEFIYEKKVDQALVFCAAECWLDTWKQKAFLTKIFHDPFVHVAFEVNHANCFLGIGKVSHRGNRSV